MTEDQKTTGSQAAAVGVPETHPHPQRTGEQARILDGESAEFRRAIEEVEALVQREWRQTVLQRHELGQKLAEIEQAESDGNGGMYGARAVEKIARYFGWSESYVRTTLRLARSLSREEVEEICSAKTRGTPFSMAHVLEFARVKDRDDRRRLVAIAADECLSAGRVAEVVSPGGNSRRPDGRGASYRTPKDATDLARQMEGSVVPLLERHEHVWAKEDFSFATLIDGDQGLERKTPNLKTKLKQLGEKSRKLCEFGEWLGRQTADALAHLDRPRAVEKPAEVEVDVS